MIVTVRDRGLLLGGHSVTLPHKLGRPGPEQDQTQALRADVNSRHALRTIAYSPTTFGIALC